MSTAEKFGRAFGGLVGVAAYVVASAFASGLVAKASFWLLREGLGFAPDSAAPFGVAAGAITLVLSVTNFHREFRRDDR